MARPANADAHATRARILEAALRLFADVGRGETSIRDIAREAGVSLGMVNHYFGSKEALYETCVATMFAELSELRGHLAPLFLRAQDPRAAVAAAVRAAFQFACEHRDASRFALRGVLESGEIDPQPPRRAARALPGRGLHAARRLRRPRSPRAAPAAAEPRVLGGSLRHQQRRRARRCPRARAMTKPPRAPPWPTTWRRSPCERSYRRSSSRSPEPVLLLSPCHRGPP
jgi:AcrR family transcriptional regulator